MFSLITPFSICGSWLAMQSFTIAERLNTPHLRATESSRARSSGLNLIGIVREADLLFMVLMYTTGMQSRSITI
jgi:ribosome-interacting GTPase 1